MQKRTIELERAQTKGKKARTVPLPPVLVSILEAKRPKGEDIANELVFDTTDLREEWGKACAAVGFGKREKQKSEAGFTWYRYSGLIIHDLRRSAVRNLVQAGVPEKVAMEISGHQTRSVFDRYNIVSPEDVSKAMDKLVAKTPRRFSASLVQVGKGSTRKLLRARSSNG